MNKQFFGFYIFSVFFIILIATLVIRLLKYFHIGFFLAVFMSSTSLYWQLKCNWYLSEKLFLSCAFGGCPIYDAVMATRKVLPCSRPKAAKGSASVLGKLLSRRIRTPISCWSWDCIVKTYWQEQSSQLLPFCIKRYPAYSNQQQSVIIFTSSGDNNA